MSKTWMMFLPSRAQSSPHTPFTNQPLPTICKDTLPYIHTHTHTHTHPHTNHTHNHTHTHTHTHTPTHPHTHTHTHPHTHTQCIMVVQMLRGVHREVFLKEQTGRGFKDASVGNPERLRAA